MLQVRFRHLLPGVIANPPNRAGRDLCGPFMPTGALPWYNGHTRKCFLTMKTPPLDSRRL
jgi:hypothetical protein